MHFRYLCIQPCGYIHVSGLKSDVLYRDLKNWKATRRAVQRCRVGVVTDMEVKAARGPVIYSNFNRPAGGVLSLGFTDQDRLLASGLLLSGKTPAFERHYLRRFVRTLCDWSADHGMLRDDWPLVLGHRPLALLVIWPTLALSNTGRTIETALGHNPQLKYDLSKSSQADLARLSHRTTLIHALMHVGYPLVAQAFFFPKLAPDPMREERLARQRRHG